VELINHTDIEVTVLASGAEALHAIGTRSFDCVMVVPEPADMNVGEFLRGLAAAAGEHRVPVLVYTAQQQHPLSQSDARRFCETLLVKCIGSPEELIQNAAIHLHRRAEELPDAQRNVLEQIRLVNPVLHGRRILVVDDDVRNLFALTSVVCWLGLRWLDPASGSDSPFGRRTLVTLGWLVATVFGTWLVSADMKDRSGNEYVNELAGNGIYQFFAAFRSAELDYDAFYRSLPTKDAFAGLRPLLKTPDATFVTDDPFDITRTITAHRPKQKLNVVLISVKSLSAGYLTEFGNTDHITPELDKLGAQSLVFTQLYATGTRTVRGLEALSLSVPPTPGESIVKRPGNENLFSLASIFCALVRSRNCTLPSPKSKLMPSLLWLLRGS
jgi:CheY-like chemotaxis protein